MTERDEFLTWVNTALYDAERALHNGDAVPRRALWSRKEPVSVLGAWRNARGQQEIDELFTDLGKSFSDCASFEFELQAYDVVGDMAYTAGLEHTSVRRWRAARVHPARHAGVPPRGGSVAGRASSRGHSDRLNEGDRRGMTVRRFGRARQSAPSR